MSVLGTFAGALGGVAGGVTDPIGGLAGDAADTVAGLGLHAIGSWVLDGTKAALQEVASIIGAATAPNLESTWFSSTYWRVAALAAILTIPFLCAAAVQALARSDLMLLAKAAFGYLPLSLIGVSLAAPLTTLLLAATDQMSSAVAATAVNGGAGFLDKAAAAAGAMSALDGSPFFAVVVGLLAVMAALGVAIELLVRAAAVYVVVLMLPLAFAAMVWPARRVWATRIVELLVSLILSKFVIVAVLSLAGAALGGGNAGISRLLMAMSLLLLSAFAPWALMRILPFTELAAGAAGLLRQELPSAGARSVAFTSMIGGVGEGALSLPSRMQQQASEAAQGFAGHSGFAGHNGSAGTPERSAEEPLDAEPTPLDAEPTPLDAEPTPLDAEPAPSADEHPPYVPPEFITREEPVRIGPELVEGVPSRERDE